MILKRIGVWAVLGVAVFVMAGCAAMMKQARQSHNEGLEVKGQVSDAVRAAEAMLRGRGYTVKTANLYKGPGSGGKTVEGSKQMEMTSREAGAALVGALTGRQSGGRKASFETVTVEINPKWAPDFENPAPGLIAVRVGAQLCAKGSAKHKKGTARTKQDECQPSVKFDTTTFGQQIKQKLEAAAQ